MSKIFKASFLMTIFFGINKIVALLRQAIIAKQFGLSADVDAFNVSNNVPDLVFSLISGGALALAFIPILTEYLDKKGYDEAWKLFSRVANLVFISTAILSLVTVLFTHQIIGSQFGIAPGFSPVQQETTARLMQINLLATLIFSISGLVMAGLQANKHFLLPAIAPILYNVGQIIGALFLAPIFGIYGLAYGVVIGSAMHLCIQIPGLMKYKFQWTPSLTWKDEGVQKVVRIMGPRIITVFFIQSMFLVRDNLASHLQEGAVTALTYGYYILQVPETLIGTAIATALLPTLAQFAEQKKQKEFSRMLSNSIRVMTALTLILTVISVMTIGPLFEIFFHFNKASLDLLVITSQAYMIGLVTQSLLEITNRAFYAQQDAKTPLQITILRTVLYVIISLAVYKQYGPVGLAMADTITVTIAVGYSLYLLRHTLQDISHLKEGLVRTGIACIVCTCVMYGIFTITSLPQMIKIFFALLLGGGSSLYMIRNDLKSLIRL